MSSDEDEGEEASSEEAGSEGDAQPYDSSVERAAEEGGSSSDEEGGAGKGDADATVKQVIRCVQAAWAGAHHGHTRGIGTSTTWAV